MSIKKTEQFLYFQNKARHYANIHNARPTINDQLEKQYRHTIDASSLQRNKKVQPYLKHQLKQMENKSLINRLVNITKSKRTEVEAQGNYSRYNIVDRQFRKKNPFRDSTLKRIQIQNQQMFSRITHTKAAVGSNSVWGADYKRQLSLKRNMSRYNDSQLSKGEIHISTSRFIPEHYKNYMDQLEDEQHQNIGKNTLVISKQKLTRLPNISGRSLSVRHSQQSQKIQNNLQL